MCHKYPGWTTQQQRLHPAVRPYGAAYGDRAGAGRIRGVREGRDETMAKPPVDSGVRLAVRQMGAILKKNALLKTADWRQTVAEVCMCASTTRALPTAL